MSEVTTALQAKKAELDAELKAPPARREIQAARDKYAASLKQIKAKQGALKRMMKTVEERL